MRDEAFAEERSPGKSVCLWFQEERFVQGLRSEGMPLKNKLIYNKFCFFWFGFLKNPLGKALE